jgi:Protein of unknown function (DUF3667)
MSTDLGETEEGIVIASAVAGDIKPVPEENTSDDCKSCGTKIEHIYCGNCGQKNDDLRRSLLRLIGESLGSLFSFESRMWRTWTDLLLKPGKVARAYANGARTIYSPPIRVYLIVSFLFFGLLAVTQTNLFAISVQPKTSVEASVEASIETSNLPTAEPETKGGSEALFDDYSFKFLFFQSQKNFDILLDDTVTNDFLKTLQEDSDINIANLEGKAHDQQFKAFQIFLKNPKQFNAAFNTWLPRVMFFMVPFAMFLGALFIRGPTALLYDHLIHAMYIHAVFFMTLLFAVILTKFIPGSFVAKALMILFVFYLPLSLKRMFNRGWFKTILTTIIVSSVYSLFLMSAIIAISIFSIVNLSA